MKVGDLVNFYSGFEPFNSGYENRNPGVVIELSRGGGWGGKSVSCTVLWSDKSITSEHAAYLTSAKKENKNSF